MATDARTIAYLLDQMARAGEVSARPMFGEYALYCGGKIVASVCDDQLFVKPTGAGRAWIGEVAEAPPYPGAKPCFLIDAERWEDGEWLSKLIAVTAAELPEPKPKKARSKAPRSS